MIQTLLDTMKRSQDLARMLKAEREAANPSGRVVSETEKIYAMLDPERELHPGSPKIVQKTVLDQINFFEAGESTTNQLNAIDVDHAKWRKNVLEKISAVGAISFCQNFGSYVLGLRFGSDIPPHEDFDLYKKQSFRPTSNPSELFWIPKGTSKKHKEIMLMRFELDLYYERAIGFRMTKRYTGQRPKIQRIGGSWVISFRGEIEIIGDHNRLKNFIPKGCNRINDYRLERLRRGF